MAEPNPSAPNPGAPAPSSGAPPNIQKLVASKRLQQAQAQVGEVVDIMRVNVEKVLERDQKLSEMDRRADELQEGASQFQQQAVKLKKKYWWENVKMWIIIGIILLFVIVIIVVTTTGGTTAVPANTGEVLSTSNNAADAGVVNGPVLDLGKAPDTSGAPPQNSASEPVTA